VLVLIADEDHARRHATEAKTIADLIDREIAARLGPHTTFEQRQEMAAAVMAEVMAQLQLADPKGGA
jgi:hypothetical protein